MLSLSQVEKLLLLLLLLLLLVELLLEAADSKLWSSINRHLVSLRL